MNRHAFVKWLTEQIGNRNVMADLRRISVDENYISPNIGPWAEECGDQELFAIRTIAGMFAFCPVPDGHVNFGQSSRSLMETATPGGDPHGINKRFRSVLDSNGEMLAHELGWFARMFKLHKIQVGWRNLLESLCEWDDADRHVQRRWAKSFWGSQK